MCYQRKIFSHLGHGLLGALPDNEPLLALAFCHNFSPRIHDTALAPRLAQRVVASCLRGGHNVRLRVQSASNAQLGKMRLARADRKGRWRKDKVDALRCIAQIKRRKTQIVANGKPNVELTHSKEARLVAWNHALRLDQTRCRVIKEMNLSILCPELPLKGLFYNKQINCKKTNEPEN